MRKWLVRAAQVVALLLVLLVSFIALHWQADLSPGVLAAKWATGASKFVAVDGMNVHYRDEGQGPTIVLLHGTGASLHTWDDWTATLAKTHRVIRMDMPGFGLTGPSPTGDYSLGAYVDFVEHVTKKLGAGHFVLAGNSLGGAIAWHFAVAHPDEVTALVLVDAAGFPRSGPPPLVFRLGRYPLLASLAAHLDPAFLVKKTLKQSYGDSTKVTPALIARYRDMALMPGNRAAFGARTAVPFTDDTANLAKLTMPILILWGALDHVIPVDDAARFQKAIPAAKLHVYPALGHVPMEEDPRATVADVTAFLTEIERP